MKNKKLGYFVVKDIRSRDVLYHNVEIFF